LALEALACTFQFLGGGTAGVCLNGMIGFGMVMGISGEVCLQTDQNGIFGTASYSVPWDRNYSNYAVGSGLGVVVQGSDARTKNDLADQFSFLNGGIGYVQGGYAWGNSSVDGRPVHVGELGLSAPTISSPGSGAAGHSNTLVSGYWYNYCDPIPCDALNAR